MPIHLDRDPSLHFDAEPDPDWHKNNVVPHADATPSFTPFCKQAKLFTAMSVYNVFLFSSVANVL